MSEYYNIAIDAGNTFIKVGLFHVERMVEKKIFETEEALAVWASRETFQNAIISSVNQNEAVFKGSIHVKDQMYVFQNSSPLPISNSYLTPQTLGKDRLAAAIGASALYPHQNCLVIDAGTCVTYDFISASAEYLGGAISPGLHMRFKALQHFTARLPLIEPEQNVEMVGRDTVSSIRSGVVNGLKFEIEKTIEEYAKRYENLHVILCGGDTHFFESIIKGVIFAFPDLVLFGLNHTLLYNAHS